MINTTRAPHTKPYTWRRPKSPALGLVDRELLKRLDTLENLASYLIAQDEQRRDLLWTTADILAAWVVARMDGHPVTPLYKAIAQATGSSSRFIRDLVRTAGAFPPEIRSQYADKTWQWFAECLREGDPRDAAARYADMSVREIRDYRRATKTKVEPGYAHLSLTLRPDHVQELTTIGHVFVSTVLSDGHQARVTITRGEAIVITPPLDETPDF